MTEDEDILVTIADVRACKYCMSGSRVWAEHHGLSWNDFVTNGIRMSVLVKLDDGLGNALIVKAKQRTRR